MSTNMKTTHNNIILNQGPCAGYNMTAPTMGANNTDAPMRAKIGRQEMLTGKAAHQSHSIGFLSKYNIQFCTRCGYYATNKRLGKLAIPCTSNPPSSAKARIKRRRRMLMGHHPIATMELGPLH